MALGKNLSRKKDSLFPKKEGKEVEPRSNAAKIKVASEKASKKIESYNISGEVTVSNIQKNYNEIKNLLNKVNELDVIVKGISSYDLSFLQLLNSLKQDKRIRLELIEIGSEKLERFGFTNIL